MSREGTFRKCAGCEEDIIIPNGLNCHTCVKCGCVYLYHPKEKKYLLIGYDLNFPLNKAFKLELEK